MFFGIISEHLVAARPAAAPVRALARAARDDVDRGGLSHHHPPWYPGA